ncbi:MAG TPA: metallophosphoesterase [Tepidisphaeraceae bacterium]|jgi:predicted phosphodiesterase|nr:metallophosphoesterase [Tepidisphaeraceae bacterium]
MSLTTAADAPTASRIDETLNATKDVIFLHLSDIHFRWPKHGRKYELDEDLRNELQRDARTQTDKLGTPTAILVTGDIAFSASDDEYKMATDWLLGDMYQATKCPGENICCIPGNHDIDWNAIRKSKSIRDCHEKLRAEQLHLLDGTIQEYLSDPFVFYRALESYNKFALQFGSDLSVEDPYWSRDFSLNDTSVLRIRGANSTLISDEYDDNRTGKLVVLGSHQCTMKNDDGVEHMFLSHHPPQWLIDQDQVDRLIHRARIQMFGHKHEQKLNEIDHRLRVAAGAVHPERKERDWKPRYNWMSIRVEGEGDHRTLEVTVHPRVWSLDQQCFVPDYEVCLGKEHRSFSLPIDSWTRPAPTADPSATSPAVSLPSGPAASPDKRDVVQRPFMDPARTLAHRFLSLPYVRRMEVAQSLKLLRDEDEGIQEAERSKRIFTRAKESRQLAQLWNEVERQHGDGKYSTNPFEK